MMTNLQQSTGSKLRAHLERSLQEAAAAVAARHLELGQRIRAARIAKAWKQKELAAAVHVEPITVSRWERGINAPDMTTLGRIAFELDITVRDLMPDAPVRDSEIAELRGEVRSLRDLVQEHIGLVDTLLQELSRPRPETNR